MVTLDDIIVQEGNPFDPITFTTGNFWTENSSALFSVESIHQEAIKQVTEMLVEITKDHATRSILLDGESGSGKSYLLSRLKQKLNSKAFFVYIEPCPSNDDLWRHTLRYVVNSLLYRPEKEQESQLILWLKSLPVFREQDIIKRLLGEKKAFIKELTTIYPLVDQARQFFSVLYELTQPEQFMLACQWLKGDDLDEEDLKTLGVHCSINSEALARLILGNFGKIVDATMPIVLCFDEVESSGEKLSDGSRDISGIFNINTTFHNSNFKNFLVIIDIGTSNWMLYKKNIPQPYLSRIQKFISLKQISLEQVEALWINRLSSLHSKANPRPNSPIAPLNRQKLESKFPGGKANLRESLNFAGILYTEYKSNLSGIITPPPPIYYDFKLVWQYEFNKIKSIVQKIREFSEPELADMLQKTLKALQVHNIQPKFLRHLKYNSSSFSCNLPETPQKKTGFFWYESENMTSFNAAMNACETVINNNLCDFLILLRAEKKIGKSTARGTKLYNTIFGETTPHSHIIPSIEDIYYLRTYQKLANAAESGNLTVNFQTTNLPTLEKLVRESGVLKDCQLLQQLGLFEPLPIIDPIKEIKEKAVHFLLNLLQKECLLGRSFIIEKLKLQYPILSDTDCDEIIKAVHGIGSLTIINHSPTKPKDQLVAWVPNSN